MGSARAEARTLKPQGCKAVVVEVPSSTSESLVTVLSPNMLAYYIQYIY